MSRISKRASVPLSDFKMSPGPGCRLLLCKKPRQAKREERMFSTDPSISIKNYAAYKVRGYYLELSFRFRNDAYRLAMNCHRLIY